MTIYTNKVASIDHLPSDLDLYGFFFDYWPACRPDTRGSKIPLLIDDDTGISYTFEDIAARTDLLSLGLSKAVGIGSTSTVALISANTLDYLPAVLAVHRLGGTVSPVNPNLSAGEILHQLHTSGAQALLVSEAEPTRSAGLEAAHRAGIARDKIVFVQHPTQAAPVQSSKDEGHWTIAGLIDVGQAELKVSGNKILDEIRYRLQGDNRSRLAFVSFSSGTSGLPKGVCIAHQSPIANSLQSITHMRLPNKLNAGPEHFVQPGRDRSLGMLPFFHIYGLCVVLATSVWAGIGVVCTPRYRGTEALLQTTIRHRVSLWYLVPPVLIRLVKEADITDRYLDQLGHLKFAMSGAAPLRDDLARAFMQKFKGVRLGQGYGLTETTSTVLLSPFDQDYVLGSAGSIVPNTEIRIVATDGNDAKPGEPGELWVRGPQVTEGYLNNEKETRESFLPGGWFRTGDEVTVDSNGLFFVVDRLKEMIKTKGYQVAPAELEGLLLDSEDVRDCGVVGRPDDESGEVPVAFVSLSASALEKLRANSAGGDGQARVVESLKDLVRRNKIRYKHLADVIIVPEIPRNPSGKILRKELMLMIKSGATPPKASDGVRSRL